MNANTSYRPGGALTIIVCVLLMMDLLLCVVGAGSDWLEIDLLQSAAAGAEITESAAMENDMRQAMIGLMQIGVYLFTIIFFCMWIFRANKNARALGAENMEYTPGWSVGWFFIPFMNLFKPFCAMKEIWKASDPYANAISWEDSKVSPVVPAWWALWLLTGIVGQLSFRTAFGAADLDSLLLASWLQLAADGLGVALAATVLIMINGLGSRQHLKFLKMKQEPGLSQGGVEPVVEEKPPWMFTNAA